MNTVIKRLLGKFDKDNIDANLARLKKGLAPIFEVPTELANPIMDYMLDRSYLDDVSLRKHFVNVPIIPNTQISWIRINRLPVSPARIDDYDLLSRWQAVLSSLHSWGEKVLFLIKRQNGETRLYIGIQSHSAKQSAENCISSFYSSMPGVDLKYLDPKGKDEKQERDSIFNQIEMSEFAGAVTGIPSFRKDTQFGVLQTLDKLAFGIQDTEGFDSNYSMLVIAEPLSDNEITDLISRFQNIGSEIHTEVTQHVTQTQGVNYNEGQSTSVGIGMSRGQGNALGTIARTLLTMDPVGFLEMGGGQLLKLMGQQTSFFGNFSRAYSSSHGVNYNESLAKDYLNKFAQYTEHLTDMHCDRLRTGRSMGFWNTGVYVLSDMETDINILTGILRSVYSGDKTHIEPIRIHRIDDSNALRCIKNFNLIPLIDPRVDNSDIEEWHILGRPYQYLSTPVNTDELSLFTSLPRKDVPGLRFVKNAARFANNPGVDGDKESIALGNVVDTGIEQNKSYRININALVRHALVCGSTGSGKTRTCKGIIDGVLKHGIPVLIIEPAKDEWVRWAINQNNFLPKEQQIKIFEPGVASLEGVLLSNLLLNPFQPAAFEDSPIDMQTRCEQVTALINASLPNSDILPVIMDETLYSYLSKEISDFEDESQGQLTQYPLLEGALTIAKEILKNRGYEQRVTDSITAALDTRFKYLTRGKRGKILNQLKSTPYDTLFNHNCVINLSKLPNVKDKALIMSLLLLSLYEYRISAYTYSDDYREKAQANKLQHLTVIEEAHNVLAKPVTTLEGMGNPQKVVADLFSNMLAEIRSLGEGFLIIDQVPTKLIPDVIKNTNFKICHRMTSIDDCAVMAQALALRKDQEGIIPTLESRNVIVSSDLDDAASWVKVKEIK